MPSIATAPSKAVFAISQFHAVSPAATARASSGAIARQSIGGRASGVSAADWARTCTGSSRGSGAGRWGRPGGRSGAWLAGRQGGALAGWSRRLLDDALDGRLDPLED